MQYNIKDTSVLTNSNKPEECKFSLCTELMHDMSKLMEIRFHLR